MNLQDSFLNQVRMQKTAVNVILMNGYQTKGVICGFDPYIILLDSGGKQNIIYKHAISTITPVKPVQLMRTEEAEEAAAPPGNENTNEE